MRIYKIHFILGIFLFFAVSCSKENTEPNAINTLSITVNGNQLTNNSENIPVDASIVIVFSSAVDVAKLESNLSISSSDNAISNIAYSNQATRVTIELNLQYSTNYSLLIGDGPIGQKGESLDNKISISFTTINDGIIHEMPACTSGTNDCLQTVSLSGDGTENFNFYSSFPIYEENAEWTNITAAVIVIHGLSRNPDDYFNYLMATLQVESLENNVALIAPFFKNESEAGTDDFYWAGNDWRSGQNSVSSAKISSFEVIDQIIDQLADANHFPALKNIIITGNSSGGLFTHLYATANRAETRHSEVSFDYVVGDSQYFYYPDGQRIDENTNQLYTPAGCSGYDIWPLGFSITPPYLNSTTHAAFNEQFVDRSITYLLGNGSGTDDALNTNDCFATLLGSSRYMRGENMFRYMELVYSGIHNHSKTIVDGVLHNGSEIYQSAEFRSLLNDLLN